MLHICKKDIGICRAKQFKTDQGGGGGEAGCSFFRITLVRMLDSTFPHDNVVQPALLMAAKAQGQQMPLKRC